MAQVSSVADEQPPNPLSTTKSILLRISRFNPEFDDSNKFMEFTVSYEKWTTVLEAILDVKKHHDHSVACLLYTSPSPRDKRQSRMPSSA